MPEINLGRVVPTINGKEPVNGNVDLNADDIQYDESYTIKGKIVSHLEDNMPHQFINHKENRTYKFGFQVSVDGKPQIIYEEVV